jgi:hypothetical protein
MVRAFGMCFNRNVLIGLGVAALGVLVLAPDAFGAVLPLLVVLACPLSMVFMMRAMDRGAKQSSSPQDAKPTDDPVSSELVRLQVEVDQLRAELAGPQRPEPSA